MKRLFFWLAAVCLAIALGIFFGGRSSGLLQGKSASRIVSLCFSPVDSTTLRGLKAGLEAFGYRPGENVSYLAYGPAGDMDQLNTLAQEAVAQRPDLIFVSSTPASLAVQKAVAGTNVPVVFCPVNDPVGAGLVDSLIHPGGNFTGIKLASGDAFRMRLLLEMAPRTKGIYFPYNPADTSALATLSVIGPIVQRLGLTLYKQGLASPERIAVALEDFPAGADAIFLPRDSMVESQIALFCKVAREHHLPIAAPSALQVEAGALFSYGHDHFELGRQAAHLVDQVLKGIPPGDIPVEESDLHFVLNIRTAEQIGLQIPGHILRRADRLIRLKDRR